MRRSHICKLLSSVCIATTLSAMFTLPSRGQTSTTDRKSIYHDGWIDLNKNGRKDIYEDSKANVDARVNDLLGKMNVDEKTAQLATLYGYGRVLKDMLPTPEWKKAIWKDGIANIDEHLNGYNDKKDALGRTTPLATDIRQHVSAMNEVQRFFIEDTRLGIPVDFTDEGIRGVESYAGTNFPTQLGIGHTWDRDLVYKIGRITGLEARALGYTNVYAPILDVARDQRWGRLEETYGEDPYLAARLGVEMVKGMQKDYTVASTAKHFAIYSNNKGAREGQARTDPQTSPREVENIFLPPFKAAVKEAGILGVMASYNDYDSIPIAGSHYWLTERLRNEWGFKGYVVSDSDAVEYLYKKHDVAANAEDAAVLTLNAGLNVRTNFSEPETFILPVRKALKDGKLSMATIDARVSDVLRVKFLVGIFDNPYIKDVDATAKLVNNSEHQAVALQAARESLVLLKNADRALPLSKNIRSIAVIGPAADDGFYAHRHYGPMGGHAVTVVEGIKAKLGPGVAINYAKGVDYAEANWPQIEILPEPLSAAEQSGIDEAVRAARASDVAVVVLGDGPRTTGESMSRTSLDLPGRQLELVQAVYKTGKPVVVVLINGRPLSINWVDKYIPGILEAWFPGDHGGTAIADALFGDYNPGGKLTVTFPRTAGQIPFNFPTKPNAQWEGEKSRVNGALYYFGHGLSYTTFDYSNLRITPLKQTAAGKVTVSVDVKNTGSRDGDEVVQLYTRDVVSSVTTYEKNLRGFQRIHLRPGEARTVTFSLTHDDLALVDQKMKWVVEPGLFRVMIGSSSEDIRLKGEFEIIASPNKKL